MTRLFQTLCIATLVAAATACGSVVQEEPDGRADVSEFTETGDVPRDVPVDLRAEDGPITDGEPPPDTPDAPDTADAPDVEPECLQASDCDDGEPCNGDEMCDSGTCVPGTSLPDGTPCATASVSGTCQAGWCVPTLCPNGVVNPEAGEECDDGGSVAGDGCEPNCRYTCHGNLECADDNPCTGDRCAENEAGQICVHPSVADGTECEDGNPCTVEDECSGGTCTAGDSRSCDDDDDCTTDTCDPTRSAGTLSFPCFHDRLPNWYYDEDRDTFGDPAQSLCARTAPTHYVANDDDCCDQLSAVNPDHSAYEATPYRCGDFTFDSYDWNCNGAPEPEREGLVVGTCRYEPSSGTCRGITTPGWCAVGVTPPDGTYTCGDTPGCGEIGGWVSECTTAPPAGLDGGTDAETFLDVATDTADGGTDTSTTTCRPVVVATVQRCR